MFALKVEKAMSDAQQESQFKDLLNQHLLPLSGINHDSSKKKKEFRTFIIFRVSLGRDIYRRRIFKQLKGRI